MPRDERKRQKKLAEQATKRKQRRLAVKKAESASPAGRSSGTGAFLRAVDAPIHECLVPRNLFQGGLGTVIVSRKTASGDIATGVFLLDVFCLGVKNAYASMGSAAQYRQQVLRVSEREPLKSIDPACARKLIEGAEDYARDLGFSPHRDYQLARKILGDIDKSACPTHFEFGKDGKPSFMSGPYDTPERCRRIIETLERRCGPDGFHVMIGIGGPFLPEFDDEEEGEEEEGEEEALEAGTDEPAEDDSSTTECAERGGGFLGLRWLRQRRPGGE